MEQEALEEYCEAHSTPQPELLYRLTRETHQKVMNPRMLSGHLQGMLLTMLCRMMRARRVLEIGTYTGYSALCIAEGLADDGLLHTIEVNEEREEMIRRYLAQSPYQDKIQLHIGDALQVIPTLQEQWDMVYIDGDKEQYTDYYEMVLPQVRKGGIILADNVLWGEKVIHEIRSGDKDTKAVCAFNEHVQNDERVTNFILPVRDGLMFIEKL